MMAATLLPRVFREPILGLSAYQVADAHNLIKLDAMENPYAWPPELVDAWLETLREVALNRYPDPTSKVLTDTLKSVYAIPASAAVLLGNGSDELIQLLLMGLPAGASVLTPEPGFVMYKQISVSLSLDFHSVPLLPDSFELDLPAMLAAIQRYQPALIFLAYPNNPTGNLFDPHAIAAILKVAPGLVVIDEAYAPFANATYMHRLSDYPHLLVMRTVSKLGLAGLRLGYLAGHPILIEQLDKIRLPYNINILTQVTAQFALTNHPIFTAQTQQICADRATMLDKLNALNGITAFPSAANFILFRTPKSQSNAIFNSLKQQGILIKNLKASTGLLADCLRVTIGTPTENSAFLQALTVALAQIA